jgi:hypothetical protein
VGNKPEVRTVFVDAETGGDAAANAAAWCGLTECGDIRVAYIEAVPASRPWYLRPLDWWSPIGLWECRITFERTDDEAP